MLGIGVGFDTLRARAAITIREPQFTNDTLTSLTIRREGWVRFSSHCCWMVSFLVNKVPKFDYSDNPSRGRPHSWFRRNFVSGYAPTERSSRQSNRIVLPTKIGEDHHLRRYCRYRKFDWSLCGSRQCSSFGCA